MSLPNVPLNLRGEWCDALCAAQSILHREGLVFPRFRVKLQKAAKDFPEADCDTIWLPKTPTSEGVWLDDVLHEVFHVLFCRIPPPIRTKVVFGTVDAWRELKADYTPVLNQDWDRTVYVTEYATTHPLEDLVETAVIVVQNKRVLPYPVLKQKVRAVGYWFDRVRRRKCRK